MNNNIKILDEELKGFDDLLIKALTFDLVEPIFAKGEVECYSLYIEIDMSNCDTIKYYYSEGRPYSSSPAAHYIEINDQRFDLVSDEDIEEPNFFIRKTYKDILMKKLLNE